MRKITEYYLNQLKQNNIKVEGIVRITFFKNQTEIQYGDNTIQLVEHQKIKLED